MSEVTVEFLSRAEAEERRQKILSSIPDEAQFRMRGASYQLDAEELALYTDLLELEYLLGE